MGEERIHESDSSERDPSKVFLVNEIGLEEENPVDEPAAVPGPNAEDPTLSAPNNNSPEEYKQIVVKVVMNQITDGPDADGKYTFWLQFALQPGNPDDPDELWKHICTTLKLISDQANEQAAIFWNELQSNPAVQTFVFEVLPHFIGRKDVAPLFAEIDKRIDRLIENRTGKEASEATPNDIFGCLAETSPFDVIKAYCQELCDTFPQWLEANRASCTAEEFQAHEKTLDRVKEVRDYLQANVEDLNGCLTYMLNNMEFVRDNDDPTSQEYKDKMAEFISFALNGILNYGTAEVETPFDMLLANSIKVLSLVNKMQKCDKIPQELFRESISS